MRTLSTPTGTPTLMRAKSLARVVVAGSLISVAPALMAVGLGSSVSAQATATPVSSCSGSIQLPVPSVRLVKTQALPDFPNLSDRSEKVGTSATLPAGTYGVTGGSRDLAHPQNQAQNFEQWYAVFYGVNGAEVGRTQITPDLSNDSTFQAWNLGPMTLTADAVAVQYVHAPVPNEVDVAPESVEPACLSLTPPPPASTTSTSTTTTIPPTSSTTSSTTTTTFAPTPSIAPPPSSVVRADPPAFPVNPPTSAAPAAAAPPAPAVQAATVTAPPAPPSVAPTVAPSVSVVAPQAPNAQVLGTVVTQPLALTGDHSGAMTVLASAMVAAGGVLLIEARRRLHQQR